MLGASIGGDYLASEAWIRPGSTDATIPQDSMGCVYYVEMTGRVYPAVVINILCKLRAVYDEAFEIESNSPRFCLS